MSYCIIPLVTRHTWYILEKDAEDCYLILTVKLNKMSIYVAWCCSHLMYFAAIHVINLATQCVYYDKKKNPLETFHLNSNFVMHGDKRLLVRLTHVQCLPMAQKQKLILKQNSSNYFNGPLICESGTLCSSTVFHHTL